MTTLNDEQGRASSGVTRTRCPECKRFAKLLPGDKECAPCGGRLALDIPVRGGRR